MFEYIVRVVGPNLAKRHKIAQMYPGKQASEGKPHGNFAWLLLIIRSVHLARPRGDVAQLLYSSGSLDSLNSLVRLVCKFPNWLVFWFTWSDNHDEVRLVRLVQFNGSVWRLALLP